MLLNEAGLAKVLRVAWKSGYSAVYTGGQVMLMTTEWYVRAPMDKLPGKALGALAEHGQGLPAEAALLLQEGNAPQYVDMNAALGTVAGWECSEADGIPMAAVDLTLGAFRLFQDRDCSSLHGGLVYGIDATTLGMVAGGADNTATGDLLASLSTIRWRDAEDDAVVYMAVKRSSEAWWQILETAVLPRA